MRAALGWCLFDTPIGACGIAWGADKLAGVQLPEAGPELTRARMQRTFPHSAECVAPAWAQVIADRIRHLLEGERDALLDVPLDFSGVAEFHRQVYAITRAIPPGEVLTYGEVASRVGQPGAARAVGQALGHNPYAPVVPCHRVLAAGGASGGFSAEGGAATKLRMLEIERTRFGGQPGLFE